MLPPSVGGDTSPSHTYPLYMASKAGLAWLCHGLIHYSLSHQLPHITTHIYAPARILQLLCYENFFLCITSCYITLASGMWPRYDRSIELVLNLSLSQRVQTALILVHKENFSQHNCCVNPCKMWLGICCEAGLIAILSQPCFFPKRWGFVKLFCLEHNAIVNTLYNSYEIRV